MKGCCLLGVICWIVWWIITGGNDEGDEDEEKTFITTFLMDE